MKYPQLVSTRAVNAISDWLVSRLEQLGVEAPQIYTRLLLSLLQSSVHINDPIEFSNLETFIVNRKGGGSIRRYLQFDANTLKKLNAIQCLSEIVSPEQELTSIENLVDELWEKLKDIEKQNDRNNGGVDDSILLDVLSNSKTKTNLTVQEATVDSPKKSANFSKNFNNDKTSTIVADDVIAASADCKTEETDPKKRYFNAFPALSKEMEDSFRIWRRNSKSLTWPVNRGNILSTSSNNTNTIMATKFVNDEKVGNKDTIKINETTVASAIKSQKIEAKNLTASHLSNFQNHAIVSSTSGLKRKTRRRKSQSMSKGRTMPNMRKNGNYNDNFSVATFGAAANQTNSMSRRQNRHLSPTQWDTDFDGYWEMGRDLIKEFFAKQGDQRYRNRCNSEGSSINQQDDNQFKAQAIEFNELAMNCNNNKKINDDNSNGIQTPQFLMLPQVDISFCYDENADDDETYKSISELTADSSSLNNSYRTSPRRLYQRLVLHENDDVANEINNAPTNDNEVDREQENQDDFLQFKAKFNSNIAALWEDVPKDDNLNEKEDNEFKTNNFDESSSSLWSVPKDVPWPTVAPIKENLKNFWTIFNNHPLDFAKILQQQQQQQRQQQQEEQHNEEANMNTCASLPFEQNEKNMNFISMPNNLESFEMSNQQKHDATPIGVFLQNSIWSDNLNGGKNTDTDESFYLKVWNSNKKLYNLDAVYEPKLNDTTPDDSKITSSSSSASFQFSYGNPKWSEGINAGPTMQQQQQLEQLKIAKQEKKNTAFIEQNINPSIDCVDASMSMSTTTASSSASSYMLSSSGIFSGQTPSLQSQQQLWPTTDKNTNAAAAATTTTTTTNNTINVGQSLTELYGMCSPSSSSSQNENQLLNNELKIPETSTHITLSNHSTQSSGFVDYKRIKSLTKSLGVDHIKQQQLNYQAQLPIIKDQPRYNDDENLLTSERTHFQPIRAYADGFAFDVCSALDVINYKRSESGYLYHESNKYLEYTRNDSFMDETNNNTSGGAAMSAAPLYAGSNCEAAVGRKRQKDENDEELVLKFRIMNNDMSCQTDDEETIRQMYATQNAMKHPLYLIFSGNSTDGMKITTTGQACSDAIEALNRAVAAAAKAAAERDQRLHGIEMNPWLSLNDIENDNQRNIALTAAAVGVGVDVCGASTSNLWTTVQPQTQNCEELIGGNEIDFCNESSTCAFGDNLLQIEQQWPLHNCRLNLTAGTGGDNNKVELSTKAQLQHLNNNNNNNTTNVINNDLHTLWGMCAACNGEFKEAPPANHLLRDELNSEADQIMSDLKNMQDLYISTTETDEDDYDHRLGATTNDNIMHPMAMFANKTKFDNETWHNVNDGNETQQKVLQQVNKLIANLMRPEHTNDITTTKTTTNILADTAATAQRELGESLWPDDGEHNIWKNQNETTKRENNFKKCQHNEQKMKIDAVGANNNNNVFEAKEKQFLAQLTWEHDNLAELWAKQTPPPAVKATATTPVTKITPSPPQQQQPQLITISDTKQTANKPINDNQKENEQKATKNPTDITTTTTAANFKRIQQFLNSTNTTTATTVNNVTTGKLKLANRKRRHSASQNYAILHNTMISAGNALYAAANSAGTTATTTSNSKSISNANNNNNNNNNNFKISDLNNFNFKRNPKLLTAFSTTAGIDGLNSATTANLLNSTNALYSDDVDMESGLYDPSSFLIINNNNNDDSVDGDGVGNRLILPTKQTIITCKYWTTLDPMIDCSDTNDCINVDPTTTTFSCLVDKNDSLLKHVTMLARPLTR